uniref:Protein LTV1 homolog n=1 Tax=Phallusia mammillata TaxID=59560 RepID=A0A6F9DKR0_9ASCI|nr:protein LTV1 homolog [Phallusia mammillata]
MPRRSKKPFIDKKKSVTFQLVHRSQKDPLAADEDAPQRVLVQLDGKTSDSSANETPNDREKRWSSQHVYGIDFDDDYDYMQHLRESSKQDTTILVPKDQRVNLQPVPEDGFEELTEITKDDETVFRLPSVVFGSKTEEEVGMLHRAIPPKGPQPSWDPDIVAGLEEDFNYSDPENILDDDFMVQASQPIKGSPCIESDDEISSDFETISSNDDESYFSEEETKTRFTSYSMTSSVMRRNDNLSHLDDRFEKFYETYDDDCIGDLCQVDIDGVIPVDDVSQKAEIKLLLGIKEERESDGELDKEKCLNYAPINSDDEVMETIVKEEPREKWDCESILSTYSTLYNHPRLITEPTKKIKISDKTGMPVVPKQRLNRKQLKALDIAFEEAPSPIITNNTRKKDETKEEKSARKRAVKEARKERRQEKKATKKAFQAEKTRQNKEILNIQQNLTGVKIS